LHPGACGRCAVLAGRWYRYDAAFERHPHCLCGQIPAPEDLAGDALTDPKLYFDSISEAEQDRAFTKAGAQAIRDGADVSQVVNARRGAAGLSAPGRLTAAEKKLLNGGGRLERTDLYGRALFITREGTTKRGVYGGYSIREEGAVASREMRGGKLITRSRARTPRLMPESIYEIAADREDAIRLLTRYGYVTSNLAEKAAQASAAARRARQAYEASRTARDLT
jgi:hypothetical protein